MAGMTSRPTHPPSSAPTGATLAKRTGLSRLLHAGGHSWQGLVYGWQEPAFRQECLLAVLAVPAAFWLGQNWLETVLLLAVLLAVMVVELLNTAIEAAIDRVGPEWHALSKRAKDLGSAAVLLSLLFCGGVWASALWRHWGA
jgi:diacylglycerol kinase (ATP)